jgi:hypothetical protein
MLKLILHYFLMSALLPTLQMFAVRILSFLQVAIDVGIAEAAFDDTYPAFVKHVPLLMQV